jgi:hypothetical protein
MVKILDVRSDGSYIVWSSRGVLNLDDWSELVKEVELDNSLTNISRKEVIYQTSKHSSGIRE